MPIKNKTLLLLMSALTVNMMSHNTLNSMNLMNSNFELYQPTNINNNGRFATFGQKKYIGQRKYKYISYQDLVDLCDNHEEIAQISQRNNDHDDENDFFDNLINGEVGVLKKLHNDKTMNDQFVDKFTEKLKNNLPEMTQDEYTRFIRVMKPTFDKFGIKIDENSDKTIMFPQKSKNSIVLDNILNQRNDTQTMIKIMLSSPDLRVVQNNIDHDFNQFLIKLQLLTLNVGEKFNLFKSLCKFYHRLTLQNINTQKYNKRLEEIIPALANIILYDINNDESVDYSDLTDGIVDNVFSTMRSFYSKKVNNNGAEQLNYSIVKYIVSNANDKNIDDSAFQSNSLQNNIISYYNKFLQVHGDVALSLFKDRNTMEQLDTIRKNVIACYVELNNLPSIDNIFNICSFDGSTESDLWCDDIILMKEAIIMAGKDERMINLLSDNNNYSKVVDLLDIVADNNKDISFKQFRDEFRMAQKGYLNIKDKERKEILDINDCLGANSDVVFVGSPKECADNIKKQGLLPKRVFNELYRILNKKSGTYFEITNDDIQKILLSIVTCHTKNPEQAQAFVENLLSEDKREIIREISKDPDSEIFYLNSFLYYKVKDEIDNNHSFINRYITWYCDNNNIDDYIKKYIIRYKNEALTTKLNDAEEDYNKDYNNDNAEAIFERLINLFVSIKDGRDSVVNSIVEELHKNKLDDYETIRDIFSKDSIELFKKYNDISTLIENCNGNIHDFRYFIENSKQQLTGYDLEFVEADYKTNIVKLIKKINSSKTGDNIVAQIKTEKMDDINFINNFIDFVLSSNKKLYGTEMSQLCINDKRDKIDYCISAFKDLMCYFKDNINECLTPITLLRIINMIYNDTKYNSVVPYNDFNNLRKNYKKYVANCILSYSFDKVLEKNKENNDNSLVNQLLNDNNLYTSLNENLKSIGKVDIEKIVADTEYNDFNGGISVLKYLGEEINELAGNDNLQGNHNINNLQNNNDINNLQNSNDINNNNRNNNLQNNHNSQNGVEIDGNNTNNSELNIELNNNNNNQNIEQLRQGLLKTRGNDMISAISGEDDFNKRLLEELH